MDKNTLIVVVGPTAVGKTKLCLRLAKEFETEIISADSRQFFREMKIGTAAPTDEELNLVTHHFVGSKSIQDNYTAGMFELEVIELLKKLFDKKDTIIMTGGSGLYINAVCYGIDSLPSTDKAVRTELNKQYENEGIEFLRHQLKILDPETYKVTDLKNPKRILKALEITLTTGKPYSSYLTGKGKSRIFGQLKIGLKRDRKELYDMINERVDRMIDNGLIDEAHTLYPYKHLNALNTVGYRELFDYFENRISLQEAIYRIKQNTRRYAKRQLTWFGRDKEIQWFHPEEQDKIIHHIKTHL